jgi:hypothetical protein
MQIPYRFGIAADVFRAPMKRTILIATSVLVGLGVFGCSGDDGETQTKGHKGGNSDTSNTPPDTDPTFTGARGVRITQVAIYQGVKRTLMLEGAPVTSPIPLVVGRDAFVRVFYVTDPGYDGGEVTGELAIDGGEPLRVTGLLGPGSNDADLASTMNFAVPGDRVGEMLSYSVGLLQEGDAAEDNPSAHYPVGALETIPVEGKRNTLRVIIAPFKYNADGSGRLPDLSPEQVERYRQRFLGMYPVSNVEITVREPTPWSSKIYANGDGWQAVGFALYGFRQQDKTPDDVYYYGVFNPAASLNQYCPTGCLLGVTLLNNTPPDVGNVGLRLALGVGFDEVATDTAAHETGHAHGREHAPCGLGLDPNSIDPNYPHPKAQIGEWGYDIVNGTLYDPIATTDIMGYCEHTWISDYNYVALFNRGKNVNAAYWHEPTGAPAEYEVALVDGQGRGTWQSTVTRGRALVGSDVAGTIATRGGSTRTVKGHYFRYDHLPGGWVFFPRSDDAIRAEFNLDGLTSIVVR